MQQAMQYLLSGDLQQTAHLLKGDVVVDARGSKQVVLHHGSVQIYNI